MADKLPDASERAERYGIDRRVWRVAMLILFTVLAVTGCLMSIALGAADISVSQVVEILLHPKASPQDQIIWNIRLPRTIVGAMVGLRTCRFPARFYRPSCATPWLTPTSSAFLPARVSQASPL